jgi:hypothetical protein
VHEAGWYAEQDVDLRTGVTVAAVDRTAAPTTRSAGVRGSGQQPVAGALGSWTIRRSSALSRSSTATAALPSGATATSLN